MNESIHRLRKYTTNDPFTRVPNAAVNDIRLGLKGRGLLLFMLSKPCDWRFTECNLARELGVGRDQLRSAMRVCMEAGYVRRRWVSESCQPTIVTDVSDSPTFLECPDSEERTVVGKPEVGKPEVGKPDPLLTKEGTNEGEDQNPLSTAVDDDRVMSSFEQFWCVYPKRNGKKVGKRDALIEWRKLSWDQRRRAYVGAVNLAASDQMPKDAERFLRRTKGGKGSFPFDDWQEPASPPGNIRSERGSHYASMYLAAAEVARQREGSGS